MCRARFRQRRSRSIGIPGHDASEHAFRLPKMILGGDSAIFGVPHVLFQQRSASSICNCKTAETIRRHEAERAKLTRDFHWNWWRIPFRISSCPHLAQPVEILWRQVRIRGSHPFPTYSGSPSNMLTGHVLLREPDPLDALPLRFLWIIERHFCGLDLADL